MQFKPLRGPIIQSLRQLEPVALYGVQVNVVVCADGIGG